MSIPGEPDPVRPPAGIRVVRLGRDQHLAAARRLVLQSQDDAETAALRLVSSAPRHGIDLSLCWATVRMEAGRTEPRQVALAVPGSGRTAMMFISEPRSGGDESGAEQERAAVIDAACRGLASETARDVCLAQGLPDPRDAWAERAFLGAGFRRIAALSYLRRAGERPLSPELRQALHGPWPSGVSVRRFDQVGDRREQRAMLARTLDRTYEDTLDCPELCGLRKTEDVATSHLATGVFDPALWWILFEGEAPHGCVLMSRCPEQRSAELVYLGLSPSARGRGLGIKLLALGLDRVRGAGVDEVNCAVDRRNLPAMRLYGRAGFSAFAERLALVRPVGAGR